MEPHASNTDAISAQLRATHRVAALVAYAMGASLGAYAVVVEILARAQPSAAPAVTEAFRWIFYGVAATIVFATHVVHAVLAQGVRRAPPEERPARLASANMITLGLAEAPAILGLVLYIVWRQHTDFYVLCAFSLYLIIRHFPRFAEWERLARPGT